MDISTQEEKLVPHFTVVDFIYCLFTVRQNVPYFMGIILFFARTWSQSAA